MKKDISDKIKEIKSEIEGITAEEKLIRSRLGELKQLVSEKNKRQENLDALKLEEAALMKELGLE